MEIINPLSPKKTKEHISTVLHALAGQNGCDGEPYDQMQIAADYILILEKQIEIAKRILTMGHTVREREAFAALNGKFNNSKDVLRGWRKNETK